MTKRIAFFKPAIVSVTLGLVATTTKDISHALALGAIAVTELVHFMVTIANAGRSTVTVRVNNMGAP